MPGAQPRCSARISGLTASSPTAGRWRRSWPLRMSRASPIARSRSTRYSRRTSSASSRSRDMDLGIRGRNALLCGASRGLGKAAAMAVAKEGVDVTIVARRRDTLERTASEIRAATGVRVTTVAADITTEAGRTAALAACAEPDILLNNADGPAPGDFRTWKRETWIEALDAM